LQNKTETTTVHKITLPTPFLVGDVNVYVIKGDQVVLVDTGPDTKEAETALIHGLHNLSLKVEDVDVLLLTHHHPDHIGLAYLFADTALTAGHSKLKPWLEKDKAHFQRFNDFFRTFLFENGMEQKWIDAIENQREKYKKFTKPTALEMELKEKESDVPGLPGWGILETPGHAQTHLSFYRKEDGLIVAGDHLIAHISSNAIIEAPYIEHETRPETLIQYRNSLEKCSWVTKVLAGHGADIQNPRKLISERLSAQEAKARMFLEKMNGEKMTVFDLTKKIYPEMYKKQPDLTFSETIGHLDLLRKSNQIAAVKSNGMYVYEQIL
jgi:glyoxylase-like metal-dependent hydrolase (beta-lactamase superfamily II)